MGTFLEVLLVLCGLLAAALGLEVFEASSSFAFRGSGSGMSDKEKNNLM